MPQHILVCTEILIYKNMPFSIQIMRIPQQDIIYVTRSLPHIVLHCCPESSFFFLDSKLDHSLELHWVSVDSVVSSSCEALAFQT